MFFSQGSFRSSIHDPMGKSSVDLVHYVLSFTDLRKAIEVDLTFIS